MSKLVGIAERSWTNKNTGVLEERKVLWLERTDVQNLVGKAYEECMCRPEQLPSGTNVGDDLAVIRNDRGYVSSIMNVTQMILSATK